MRAAAARPRASSPDLTDRWLVKRFLLLSLVISLFAIPGAAVIHTQIDAGRAMAALYVLLGANAVTLWWLWRTADGRTLDDNLLGIMGATAVLSLAIVVLEPWSIHFTPMICLGALLLPLGMVEPGRYRRLLIAGLVFITAMTIVSRLGGTHGPLMDAASSAMRDLIAVVHTPILFVLVSWILWEGHAAIVRRVDGIAESQRRLVGAEEAGRRAVESESVDLRERLVHLRGLVTDAAMPVTGTDCQDHRPIVTEMVPCMQQASADLRQLSHGILAPELSGTGNRPPLAGFDDLVDWPVEITVAPDVVDLPEIVKSTLQICAADSLRNLDAAGVERAELRLSGDVEHLTLTIEYQPVANQAQRSIAVELPPSLSVQTLDRVRALGGTVTNKLHPDHLEVEVQVPHRPGQIEPQTIGRLRRTADRGLSSALARAATFPVAGLVVSVAMWLFVLPHQEMALVVALIALAYTGPCLAAVAIARRAPRAAIGLSATAHWVIAVAVATQFTIIKFFLTLALLIPIVAAMPYLSRAWYRRLVVMSAIVAAVATAMTRLVDQLEIANDSPPLVNKAIVATLIPAACAIVLALAWRNHAALVVRAAELRTARLRVVEAIDRVRRQVERDLHDGAQQRLVSAALRAKILTRLDPGDRARVADNLRMLDEELQAAEQALHVLERSEDEITTADSLVKRLQRLGVTSPVPLELRVGRLPHGLASEVATTLWFCCSEAVGNVAKHAGPGAKARIELDGDLGSIRFRVVDDGRGFDWPAGSGRGLRNLADRTGVLGGSLDISSSVGVGTIVTGSIPLT